MTKTYVFQVVRTVKDEATYVVNADSVEEAITRIKNDRYDDIIDVDEHGIVSFESFECIDESEDE